MQCVKMGCIGKKQLSTVEMFAGFLTKLLSANIFNDMSLRLELLRDHSKHLILTVAALALNARHGTEWNTVKLIDLCEPNSTP